MTINLTEEISARLASLAHQQGRDVEAVVREAVQRYLVEESITDLDSKDIAQTQEELLPEIGDILPWS